MRAGAPALPAALLALTPGDLDEAGARALLPRVGAALGAGLGAVLLREPGLADRALFELARRLRELLGAERWLGVHDRLHVALAAQADGAHLGFRSLPLAEARRAVGPKLALGFSAHAGDGPDAWVGADYLFFGPLRATPSKRDLVEPTGLACLAGACKRAALPVWAIGGLEPSDGQGALAAGASGVAVLRGVFGAVDPAAAVRAYLAGLGAAQGAPRN